MKKLLHRLDLSVKHLQTLDNVLQSKYEEYRNFAHKIESLPRYQELLKEIYIGGRGRQMILGDLLEYILTGRAYYFATKGESIEENTVYSFPVLIFFTLNTLVALSATEFIISIDTLYGFKISDKVALCLIVALVNLKVLEDIPNSKESFFSICVSFIFTTSAVVISLFFFRNRNIATRIIVNINVPIPIYIECFFVSFIVFARVECFSE